MFIRKTDRKIQRKTLIESFFDNEAQEDLMGTSNFASEEFDDMLEIIGQEPVIPDAESSESDVPLGLKCLEADFKTRHGL